MGYKKYLSLGGVGTGVQAGDRGTAGDKELRVVPPRGWLLAEDQSGHAIKGRFRVLVI
jgi:hypothetical protein